MKIFELSWRCYEDYCPYLFSHETKTKEEFNEDVKSILIKYGNEYINQETSWVGASDWIKYIVDKMPELGYQLVKPEIFSIWGAFIIDGDDETDIDFGNIVGIDLLHKAIEHNNNLRIKMNYRNEKNNIHQ